MGHATFADFLASRWVVAQALQETKIRALLISGTGRLYPRVRQIAAWLVATSSEFAWLIEIDPEAFLLNVDIADVALRKRIVSAVLLEAERGRLHYDYHKNLSGLSHPELKDQIHSALLSPNFDVARIAIDIARQCHLQEASSDLVGLALNEKAELGLRVAAAWSVSELAKDNPDDALLPLLDAPLAGEDDIPQSQELIAAALMASWPHAITTAEVFKLLDPQNRKNFIGIYSMAIAELARSLNADDLQPACEWLLSKPHLFGDSRVAPLEQAILRHCLAHLDQGLALKTATSIAKHRLQAFEPLLNVGDGENLVISSSSRRTLVSSLLEDEDLTVVLAMTDRLLGQGVPLLSAQDFEWLMEQFLQATGTRQRNIAKALQRVADPHDRSHLESILGLPDDHPAAPVFLWWRGPIELASQEAAEERETLRMNTETGKKIAARNRENVAVDERIRGEIPGLARQARDGNPTAFITVTRLLTVPPGSAFYRDEHEPDLTRHPR